MKKLIVPVLLGTALLVNPASASANTTRVEGRVIRTNYSELIGDEPDLEIAEDVRLVEKRVISEIKRNETIGEVRVTLISPQHTGVKLRFSDPLLALRGKNKDLDLPYQLHPNIDRTIYLTAYGETEGLIEILNMKDEVLLTVPYKVINARSVRQSLSMNTRTPLSEGKSTLNMNYSLSTVREHKTDGIWSFRLGVQGVGDSREVVNTGVTYSW